MKDSHDTEHSVIVYAESLYEAVLRGLNQLADVGWESDVDETIKHIEVEIFQEPTRHTANVPNLLKWLKQGFQQLGTTNQAREAEEVAWDAMIEYPTSGTNFEEDR